MTAAIIFAGLALIGVMRLATAQSGAWAQCGGIGFSGSTSCISGYYCKYQDAYWSQCVPGTGGGTSTSLAGCAGGAVTVTESVIVTVTNGGGGGTTTSISTTRISTTTTKSTSTATTTTAGGGTSGSASVDKLEGYGMGTTGGGSGLGITVTSCSGLSSAVSAGGVIKVSGILSGCGIIKLKGNTSIIGVGSNSGMTKGGFQIKGISNVIIRNMKFYMANAGDDLVALDTSTKVWIDHCEFYNGGLTGDKDYYDGLLDITHGCDYITISWCKFHDHWKGSLIGHSDGNGNEDTGKLHVTFHHNHWYNVNSRLPSLRFGTGHIYSSCFISCPTSGINSRMGAKVLVENNSFTDVKLAIVTDLDSDETGNAVEKNNLFLGSTTTRITQTGSFTPGYSYTMDPASSVCAITSSKAGVGIVG